MNGNNRSSSERSPIEVVVFVITALGFFSGVAGPIVSSIAVTVLGGLMLGLGLTFFALREG